jgi:hypothetical protein
MSAYGPALPDTSSAIRGPADQKLTRDEVMIAREVAELLKVPVSTNTSSLAAATCPRTSSVGRGGFCGPGSRSCSLADDDLRSLQRLIWLERQVKAGKLNCHRGRLLGVWRSEVEGDRLLDGLDQLRDGVAGGETAWQLPNLGPGRDVLVMHGDV